MAKVLCVLYDYSGWWVPRSPTRAMVRAISSGTRMARPRPARSRSLHPGSVSAACSGELGVGISSRSAGHTLVVTSDKDVARLRREE